MITYVSRYGGDLAQKKIIKITMNGTCGSGLHNPVPWMNLAKVRSWIWRLLMWNSSGLKSQ